MSATQLTAGRRRRPSPHYGLPTLCHCGAPAILKQSLTAINPGRLFFTCRVKEREMSLDEIMKEELQTNHDGKRHIWKWWDDAVMEELDIVRVEIYEAQETYQVLLRRIGAGMTAVNDPTGRIFSGELAELREIVDGNKLEIVKLQEQVNTQSTGYVKEATYAVVALLFVCAGVVYMFK